jgi:hypothetical protein
VRRLLPLTLAAALVLPALPALAGPIDSAVNGSRSDWLPSRADLDTKAHGSAASQAANLQIAHTSLAGLGDICSAAGEIVGMGPTVSAIFDLFLKSSSHREILLSPVWTAIGTGAVTGSDGNLYVSVVFCKEANSTPSTPPSPTVAPTPTVTTTPTATPTSPFRTVAANSVMVAPALSFAAFQEVSVLLLLGELDHLWLIGLDPEGWRPPLGPSPFLPLAQWMDPNDPMIT